ncbi:MAG: glucose-1-phosphate cytidylyltransferase [Candidatus Micrarchaeota archaeon]
MKVVILCGGAGTRLREQTEYMPKPLVRIGGQPILWHIMKIYSHFGYKDFVLSLGYKGEMIKEYFLNYEWKLNDFTMSLSGKKEKKTHVNEMEDWTISFADTGLETLTAGRIKKVEKYIDGQDFMCTYGDGVANVGLDKLVNFHKKSGKLATLTAVHPRSKYGALKFDKTGIVTKFEEKPVLNDWINGGFFAFKNEALDHIPHEGMLEDITFKELISKRQLSVFLHEEFWHCMDTYKDYEELNKIYGEGKPPWMQF